MKIGYELPILMYHRIVDSKSEVGKHNIYVKVDRFRKQLEYIKNKGYQTITFRDLAKIQDPGQLYKKIILTFDDGYEDNYTLLFPLLKEFNYTAVIFLVTQLTQNEWGIREGEPALKLMNKEQLIEMDKYGIEFGGHTQTHVDLKKAPADQAKQEIEGSKRDVENIVPNPVISFAYPFGAFNEESKKIVNAAGYKYGIATKSGPFNWKDDLFQMRRIEIGSQTIMPVFKRKVSGNYNHKKFDQLEFVGLK